MTEPPRPAAGSDVDPLVWGVWGGGVLSVVVVLTLLVSDRFTTRGLLLVFAVPLLVVAVVVVARRLPHGRRDGTGLHRRSAARRGD